jgi:AraC family transcriptional regulator
MEPKRYENAGPLVIAGLGGNFSGDTLGDIPALWMRFAPHIGHLKDEVGNAAYGVVSGMSSGNGFHYTSGVEVKDASDLPEDFETIAVPARRYAVFGHSGHVSKLSETVTTIWRDWLPRSGHEHAGKPDLLERYGEDFDPETGMGGMEVWIPIKA